MLALTSKASGLALVPSYGVMRSRARPGDFASTHQGGFAPSSGASGVSYCQRQRLAGWAVGPIRPSLSSFDPQRGVAIAYWCRKDEDSADVGISAAL